MINTVAQDKWINAREILPGGDTTCAFVPKESGDIQIGRFCREANCFYSALVNDPDDNTMPMVYLCSDVAWWMPLASITGHPPVGTDDD